MKKMFTLVVAALFSTVLLAAGRNPFVSISTFGNYKVVVDGYTYFAKNGNIELQHLAPGKHTIAVYEMQRNNWGGTKEVLVSKKNFQLKNNNILVQIDSRGKMQVKTARFNTAEQNRAQARVPINTRAPQQRSARF